MLNPVRYGPLKFWANFKKKKEEKKVITWFCESDLNPREMLTFSVGIFKKRETQRHSLGPITRDRKWRQHWERSGSVWAVRIILYDDLVPYTLSTFTCWFDDLGCCLFFVWVLLRSPPAQLGADGVYWMLKKKTQRKTSFCYVLFYLGFFNLSPPPPFPWKAVK